MNERIAISRRDAVVIGSRLLAVLLTVWTFSEIASLPTTVYAFLRYAQRGGPSSGNPYWHHHYLMSLGFLITRIVGFSLMAAWLFRCGPDIEDLLLPVHLPDDTGE
jgi:hypothetical protein